MSASSYLIIGIVQMLNVAGRARKEDQFEGAIWAARGPG